MVKYTVELEDIRTRYSFPQDRFLIETLFPSSQPTYTHYTSCPSPVLTFTSFAVLSLFEVLKTFTATGSPFCVPQ